MQLAFVIRSWGGARVGAGRKKTSRNVPHRRRVEHKARNPVLVTLRAAPEVGNLREAGRFKIVRDVLRSNIRDEFRVVHFSVMSAHIHLIAEARDKKLLRDAVRALQIKIAQRLNRLVGRKGSAFPDRYHARELTNPRQTRHAVAYCLLNRNKHARERGAPTSSALDTCSSAASFDGFKNRKPTEPPHTKPQTWLLKIGWRNWGLISPAEVPSS